MLKRAAGVRTAEDILHNVRSDKKPTPSASFTVTDVRRDWEGNHSSDERSEEHMQPLLTSFDTLEGVFAVDEVAMRIIKREPRRRSNGSRRTRRKNLSEALAY